MIRLRSECWSSASAKWPTTPERKAVPKLTTSATTATITISHTRSASTGAPSIVGSSVRASSTIAMNGITLLAAPTTASTMIPARLPLTAAKRLSSFAGEPPPTGSVASVAVASASAMRHTPTFRLY